MRATYTTTRNVVSLGLTTGATAAAVLLGKPGRADRLPA
jgi:hypothetical protein